MKALIRVTQRGQCQYIISRCHFHFDIVSTKQHFLKFISGDSAFFYRKNQLRTIEIINTVFSDNALIHQMNGTKFFCPFINAIQPLSKFIKSICSLLFHITNTFIYSSHQNIGRAAGLVHLQKHLDFLTVNEFSVDMDQCCLCIRRQRFMKTVDHDICPKMHGIFREIFGKSEMCSMSFIHDQRFSMCMCNFCNSLHIRNNAIISWRSNYDRLDFRMLLKRTLHICWIDTAI